MAMTPKFLSLVIAIILFAAAALWHPPQASPVNLTAAGLAFLALALLL